MVLGIIYRQIVGSFRLELTGALGSRCVVERPERFIGKDFRPAVVRDDGLSSEQLGFGPDSYVSGDWVGGGYDPDCGIE